MIQEKKQRVLDRHEFYTVTLESSTRNCHYNLKKKKKNVSKVAKIRDRFFFF